MKTSSRKCKQWVKNETSSNMRECKWIKVKKWTKDKDVFKFWGRIAKASRRLENNKTQSASTDLILESSKDASDDDNNKKTVMKTKRVLNSRKSNSNNGSSDQKQNRPLGKTEVPKFIVDAKKVEKYLVDNFTGGMHVPH